MSDNSFYEDKNIFKLLYSTTVKILYFYQYLYDLDIHGLKDSQDYNLGLEELKKIVEAEKRFYEEEAEYFIAKSNIMENLESNSININIEESLVNSYTNLSYFRIFNKFHNLSIPSVQDEGELDRKIIIDHSLNLFNLSILDRECHEEHPNKKIQTNLIKMKYNEIFTYHLMEEQLLDNEFNISYPGDIITDLYQYGQDDYFVSQVCAQHNYFMSYVMKFKSDELEDSESFSIIQYILCMLKASLILFPKELVDLVHKDIEENLKEIKKKNKEKTKILELVNQNIYDAKADRKKYIL